MDQLEPDNIDLTVIREIQPGFFGPVEACSQDFDLAQVMINALPESQQSDSISINLQFEKTLIHGILINVTKNTSVSLTLNITTANMLKRLN